MRRFRPFRDFTVYSTRVYWVSMQLTAMQTAHPRCLISKFLFSRISRCSPVEYRDFAISQRLFVLNHRRIVHGSRTISMSIYDRKGGKLCFVKRKDNVFLSGNRVMFEEKVWIFRVLPFWIKKVVDFLSNFLLFCMWSHFFFWDIAFVFICVVRNCPLRV